MRQPKFFYTWLVLFGALLGIVLAIATFPAQPLPWSTVLFGALGIGVVGGIIATLAYHWQKRRGS